MNISRQEKAPGAVALGAVFYFIEMISSMVVPIAAAIRDILPTVTLFRLSAFS